MDSNKTMQFESFNFTIFFIINSPIKWVGYPMRYSDLCVAETSDSVVDRSREVQASEV